LIGAENQAGHSQLDLESWHNYISFGSFEPELTSKKSEI
jgi:hypothetical protein